jgi:hypothetical protein
MRSDVMEKQIERGVENDGEKNNQGTHRLCHRNVF